MNAPGRSWLRRKSPVLVLSPRSVEVAGYSSRARRNGASWFELLVNWTTIVPTWLRRRISECCEAMVIAIGVGGWTVNPAGSETTSVPFCATRS